MKVRFLTLAVLILSPAGQALAALSVLPDQNPVLASANADPAVEARKAFAEGRHAKAVEIATPLAEQGNNEAIFLLGLANETGQGTVASREKALELYRKAAGNQHKEAAYRLAGMLVATKNAKDRDEAVKALEAAAKDDPANAGRLLGQGYVSGELSEKPDADKALFWWRRASDAGNIEAMTLMGRFFEGQLGFPERRNPEDALVHYAKAAGLGHAPSMVIVGSRMLSGDPKVRDEKQGREWLRKAVAAKDYSACLVLGDYDEFQKKDLKSALVEYERGKDGGQLDCMLRAGTFYIEGKGVEKDVERGMALVRKAAESGHPEAHLRLAASFLGSEKPSQGDTLAGYGHLVAAASGGNPTAQNELGLLYLSGRMGARDNAAAVSWLTNAARAGNAKAQNNLAQIFQMGIPGTAPNIDNAVQLYTLSANQGHGPAILALARLQLMGVGVKADPPKAWALATLAGEAGEKDAEALVKEIELKFTDKQRAEARKQLEEFRAGKPAAKPASKPTFDGSGAPRGR